MNDEHTFPLKQRHALNSIPLVHFCCFISGKSVEALNLRIDPRTGVDSLFPIFLWQNKEAEK